MSDIDKFSEKFLLACEASKNAKANMGLCGLEVEWNLLDSQFYPLLTVGSGPDQLSFVDYLRAEHIPVHLRKYSQLEVFHWMIEWATRPYINPRAAIFESRLMEAALINALYKAGREFDERLYIWHGNLPFATSVSYDSIPGSWHLAKRRYLERCIQLYGDSLATTGTHSNLSLPNALFEWDYMQVPNADRTGKSAPPVHLDEYKSQFYITATRMMRAFACLFIATSASTPFRPGLKNGHPVVYLTNYDSIRSLTFPNPVELDLPGLYRSLDEYKTGSYELVRQGVRFGNNNWSPVRARSFAEPVERLIASTSDQLHELYSRGLFVLGQDQPLDDLADQIEMQNLLARIDLPMARVEVRTDDGGNPLDLEVANLTLKHLLLIRYYADPQFAQSFRYDQEDIGRARNNEEVAAKYGLKVDIQNPLTKKSINMRDFLGWTLAQVESLADKLSLSEELIPLKEMATGAPNYAQQLRTQICTELGGPDLESCDEIPVPLELLQALAEAREDQVSRDVEEISETYQSIQDDRRKLGELLQYCREDVHRDPSVPIRFKPRPEAIIEFPHPDKTSEIVSVARQLISIPSVTAGSMERSEEVQRSAIFIYDLLKNHNVGVDYYGENKYPAIHGWFPGQNEAPVMLSGHFDVVAPEPDDSQFVPRLEGDYLWGRGSADMKTVLATYLVWMKDQMKRGAPYPPINLLLVGNEEIGETEPMGTPHVLDLLKQDGYAPELLIAGERTGEQGDEMWGEICTENRGVMRFEMIARGESGHTGVTSGREDISQKLFAARSDISQILGRILTLDSSDGWQTQINFPFVQVGEHGVYNIRAKYGSMGVEIRPIPEDDLFLLQAELMKYCDSHDFELNISVMENGISCDLQNPYLVALIGSVRKVSNSEPRIGKKLPGTSARFAPQGQGLVWGQSGLGPHARDERHFVPSILPHYQALTEFARVLSAT